VAAQLLIDMPAEGAARLLTLSLLEQLSLHAVAIRDTPEATAVGRTDDAVRAAVNRLRGCVLLYREALGASMSRKARRRLRAVAKAANALHRSDVQLAWLAETKPPVHTAEGNGADSATSARPVGRASAQAVLAAEWLRDRLVRRRAATALALQDATSENRALRRFAKRLSVYTTAVRLDDMMMSASFGALTGRQLATGLESLWPTLAAAFDADDYRTVRRARRKVDLLVYLLEPIRSAPEAMRVFDVVDALRADVVRLEGLAAAAEAVVEGGRRIGALHMMKRVRSIVWAGGREGSEHVPDEIGGGIVALAELLRDDLAEARAATKARWMPSELDLLATEVGRIATVLGES
jgi:hypothetical protein